MTKVAGIAALLVFGLFNAVGLTLYAGPVGLGFGPSDFVNQVLPLAGSMLLGILVSAVVAALKQMPQDQIVRMKELANILLRPNTFIALLVSPLVFYGTLIGLGDGRIEPLVYFGAFQNGFFWQTALVPPRAKSP